MSLLQMPRLGGGRQVAPARASLLNDSQVLLVLSTARQQPPALPDLSSQRICRLRVEAAVTGDCTETLSRSFPALSLPPTACFHVSPASHFCTCSAGGGGSLGLLPCSPLLPLASPPAQALCENLPWPPPQWGWPFPGECEIMTLTLTSQERQLFAESDAVFNLRACFEEFGF